MTEIISVLGKARLFDGFSEQEIRQFLSFSGGQTERYKRNSIVILEGAPNCRIGVILEGGIIAERVFPDGAVSTVSEMSAGGVFGNILSGSNAVSPVTVIAAVDTEVFFFSLDAALRPNDEYSDIQMKLARNLILDVSNKYFEIERRASILASGNLRRKILLYLCHYCRHGEQGAYFQIRHTREQQAVYLGCERTALSRELAKMKRDGLIDYDKNRFRVLLCSHACPMAE